MLDKSHFKGSQNFYEERSWGALAIKEAKDLPTIKLRYLLDLLNKRDIPRSFFLEIGCGSGRIISSIREQESKLRLIGLDRSGEQIKIAHHANQAQEVSYLLGDGQILPFQDETFDYVAIMDFLEHIPNPQNAIREAWRLLKPHGHLHAFVPAEGQPYSIYGISQKVFGIHFKELTCGHIQKFRLQDIEEMVGQQFRIVGKKFSYHLLGSFMDYLMFALLLNKRIANVFWAENKYYKGDKRDQSMGAHVLNVLLTLGNRIAFYESTILQNIRVSACGIHLTAVKMPM
jgi:ubiquinone/menaquinone biosynthesis C-methylase UbiE